MGELVQLFPQAEPEVEPADVDDILDDIGDSLVEVKAAIDELFTATSVGDFNELMLALKAKVKAWPDG